MNRHAQSGERLRRLAVPLVVLTFAVGCWNNRDGQQGTPAKTPEKESPPTKKDSPVAKPQLPDLVISDIRVEPKPHVVLGYAVLVRGTEYKFIVEVANRGPGPMTGGIQVSVAYGCQGPGIGQSLTVSPGSGLAVGEKRMCAPFTVKIPTSAAPGTCKFKFVVDPDNVTSEVDESNNVWETRLSVH